MHVKGPGSLEMIARLFGMKAGILLLEAVKQVLLCTIAVPVPV